MSKKGRESLTFGQVAEHRITLELQLRGYNPGRFYLDLGVDMILQKSKIGIQVKGAHLHNTQDGKRVAHVNFIKTMEKKGKRIYNTPTNLDDVDFVIIWVVDIDDFYIIPADAIRGKLGIHIRPYSKTSKWNRYKNAWSLLPPPKFPSIHKEGEKKENQPTLDQFDN